MVRVGGDDNDVIILRTFRVFRVRRSSITMSLPNPTQHDPKRTLRVLTFNVW